MSRQGSLSIERMCRLAGVSRAGFYRTLEQQYGVEQDMELRSMMQQVAVQNRRRYGYRRITQELQKRGFEVNHKRVRRMMKEDDLLSLRRRKFVVTTDSQHPLEVHLNLARRLKLTGINQLWVADITYIRLRTEFVYLAVMLDAFSRKVVGWALDRSLASALAIRALQQALVQRQPPPGLVHHSDRGLQYACGDYVRILHQHHMLLSMSRAGNPFDNATCESFIKTLKVEEIYTTDYDGLEHLSANLEDFIERYYNRCRLHSALGYLSPEEFEQALPLSETQSASLAPRVSFLRHEEIYRSNGEQS
jgi:transposase InsO family protein